jgi:hypothetical protein
MTNPTIGKLRKITLHDILAKLQHEPGTNHFERSKALAEAEAQVKAWALEIADGLEPHIDVGSRPILDVEIIQHIEGYKHAKNDFRAKLTGAIK